jgi:hypothetical protein
LLVLIYVNTFVNKYNPHFFVVKPSRAMLTTSRPGAFIADKCQDRCHAMNDRGQPINKAGPIPFSLRGYASLILAASKARTVAQKQNNENYYSLMNQAFKDNDDKAMKVAWEIYEDNEKRIQSIHDDAKCQAQQWFAAEKAKEHDSEAHG